MPRKPKKKSAPPTARLRIIGGRWRSRLLTFPEVEGLRPTGNRIRETLFNWLAPVLPGAVCLDAFAGSGAIGFEALSRGARHCTFVERNAQAARALEDNARLLQEPAAEVLSADLLVWLAGTPERAFDLVFLDPPFAAGLWQPAIAALANGWLAPGAWVYLECPLELAPPTPAHWRLHRQKQAGQVAYQLYRLAPVDS